MNETLINFEDVRRYLKDKTLTEYYTLEEGLMMGFQRINDFVGNKTVPFSDPISYNGLVLLYVHKGCIGVKVNVSSYQMKESSLLMLVPGNIIRLFLPEGAVLSDIELYYLIFSRDYLDSLGTYGRRSIQDRMKIYSNPYYVFSEYDKVIVREYFNLASRIMKSGQKYKNEIVSGLVASLSFYTVPLIEQADVPAASMHASRRNNQTFEKFIALVKEHHVRERGLTFYAEQMSISRKYLGKVVRQASGRKALEWIDDFVIMEAKSMLKFSDKSIKEIVFNMNFVNQSVFYKYFKAHTGMTPSEYRKK